MNDQVDTKLEEKLETVADFLSYEEYLDSQIQPLDEYFLEDKELARELVQLGYRGGSQADTISREEFAKLKRIQNDKKSFQKEAPKLLASAGKTITDPFLVALADREELVRSGKLTTIIYIRTTNKNGQEVSAYIDFAHRLKADKFERYFDEALGDARPKFQPKPSDLSYYNFETQHSTSNSNSNFQVIAHHETGLLFKNKRDRKTINVDPNSLPGDNSTRTEIKDSEDYLQVVIFDHMTRRKG